MRFPKASAESMWVPGEQTLAGQPPSASTGLRTSAPKVHARTTAVGEPGGTECARSQPCTHPTSLMKPRHASPFANCFERLLSLVTQPRSQPPWAGQLAGGEYGARSVSADR